MQILGGEHDDSNAAVALGPGFVDYQVRQAISHCWFIMPSDKRNAHDVEIEIRRIVDRALKDLHEDAKAFGIGTVRPAQT